MSQRLAILCPGQGMQHPAMFDLARTDPAAAAWLDRQGLVADSAALQRNRDAQPLLVGAMLAHWQALRVDLPAPVLAAGYSIGELAAYAVAGAIGPDAAVALARTRAQAMDACVGAPQAMAALGGLPLPQLAALAEGAQCAPAIVTGDDTLVAGGLASDIEALLHAAPLAGARAQRLAVAVASHTLCMAAAVAPFRAALEQQAFAPFACPVVAGISAQRVHARADAIALLARQLAEPILWADAMDTLAEAGVTVALELGPGNSLSRMLAERHPAIACRSVSEFRSLAGAAAWVQRQA